MCLAVALIPSGGAENSSFENAFEIESKKPIFKAVRGLVTELFKVNPKDDPKTRDRKKSDVFILDRRYLMVSMASQQREVDCGFQL